MKKSYIAPSAQVIKLDCNDIIATSFGLNDTQGNGSKLSHRWHGRQTAADLLSNDEEDDILK